MGAMSGTELLYLRDANMAAFDGQVVAVDEERRRIALDRTAFYPTSGGQPHDTGDLAGLRVTDVRKEGDLVWHSVGSDGSLPAVGDHVRAEIDWDRRWALMRTHTALHVSVGSSGTSGERR